MSLESVGSPFRGLPCLEPEPRLSLEPKSGPSLEPPIYGSLDEIDNPFRSLPFLGSDKVTELNTTPQGVLTVAQRILPLADLTIVPANRRTSLLGFSVMPLGKFAEQPGLLRSLN